MADDSSWWDTGINWVSDNWDTIAKGVGVASGAYGIYNETKARNAHNEYLREVERARAEQINAENDYLTKVAEADRLAQVNNSAAQTGAMHMNEANRLKAALRASKYSKNTYRKILKMYEPYRKTAEMLLPQMTQTYQNSLGLQNAMGAYVQNPTQMAKLNAETPAYQVNIPLPDSVRIK